jgi:hypothetical protein
MMGIARAFAGYHAEIEEKDAEIARLEKEQERLKRLLRENGLDDTLPPRLSVTVCAECGGKYPCKQHPWGAARSSAPPPTPGVGRK